jgi:hypothetical protein
VLLIIDRFIIWSYPDVFYGEPAGPRPGDT